MTLGKEKIDSIVITRKDSENPQLVTATDNQEVIAVISDSEVIVKDGYEVKCWEGAAQ